MFNNHCFWRADVVKSEDCWTDVEYWKQNEGNKLTMLCENMIASWTRLTELNAGILSIPSSIMACSSLMELYTGNNSLSSLPAAIGTLSQLGTFDLHSNQLKEYPVDACKLRLSVLDLSNNSLSGLPTEIGYFGVLVSDPWLQNQFTQVELRSLKSHFSRMKRENVGLMLADLPSKMSTLKQVGENLTDQDRTSFIQDSYQNLNDDVDFELFLRVYLKLQSHATTKMGSGAKNSSAFLTSPTSTLLHTISESEKSSYVAHINHYLAEDEFLKKYLPIDPSTNDLFEIAKDGVLICKLINMAVPGTIDDRAINTKRVLNPWERNENHTL